MLSKKIERYSQTVNDKTRILFISRQYFDQDRGHELLKRVCHVITFRLHEMFNSFLLGHCRLYRFRPIGKIHCFSGLFLFT